MSSSVGPIFCSVPAAPPATTGVVTQSLSCALTGLTPISETLSFTSEGVVPTSFVLAPTPPPLPANVFTAVNTGASQIRQRVTLSADQTMLVVEHFVVPPSSALPFPGTTITAPGTVISRINMSVQNVIITDGTNPTVDFSGTVVSNPVGVSIFGDLTGRAADVSVGFGTAITIPGFSAFNPITPTTGAFGTTNTPTPSTMLQVVVAGAFTTAAPTATSTVVFTTGGTTPVTPPTPSSAPTIVIKSVSQPVASSFLMLDATGTTTPAGGPITFAWTSIGNQAAISGANTATPTIQFVSGPKPYMFQVTATNAQGFSSVATLTINFVGR